jgi:ABC-type dipeptide/oligopeptide/nickel transport system permease subunit
VPAPGAACCSARAPCSVLVIIVLFVLIAVFAPLITPYDPAAAELDRRSASRPSLQHWFGTDESGATSSRG